MDRVQRVVDGRVRSLIVNRSLVVVGLVVACLVVVGLGLAGCARAEPASSSPEVEDPVAVRRQLDRSVGHRDPVSGRFRLMRKVHPHLQGEGLVVTYCTNSKDFDDQLRHEWLHVPRFARVDTSN